MARESGCRRKLPREILEEVQEQWLETCGFARVQKAGVDEGRFRPGVENSSDVASFRLRVEEEGNVLRSVTNHRLSLDEDKATGFGSSG